MSLYKNCGRWKNFDYIFEFSVKSYVRNTINLLCAKIVFPRVIKRACGCFTYYLPQTHPYNCLITAHKLENILSFVKLTPNFQQRKFTP